VISAAQRVWTTWRRAVERVITTTIFLAAGFLLADTLYYALTGVVLIGWPPVSTP
jgi:hypothetical protein